MPITTRYFAHSTEYIWCSHHTQESSTLEPSKPVFGPARHLHPATTCLPRNQPAAPQNQAFHPGLPPCTCTITLIYACLSVRGRFCSCEVHPHITIVCLLSHTPCIVGVLQDRETRRRVYGSFKTDIEKQVCIPITYLLGDLSRAARSWFVVLEYLGHLFVTFGNNHLRPS